MIDNNIISPLCERLGMTFLSRLGGQLSVKQNHSYKSDSKGALRELFHLRMVSPILCGDGNHPRNIPLTVDTG